MKTLRLLTLMAACCAAGTMSNVAFGAENTTAKPGATAATPATPAPDKPAGESAAQKADEQSSAAQPSAAREDTQAQIDEEARQQAQEQAKMAKTKPAGKGSPDRFTPSEQVRADFDVSFPIDI